MELIDVFKQLMKDYPETFKLSERYVQLDLIDCPWNIASIKNNICGVHGFTQNTVDNFDYYEWRTDVTLNFYTLVTIYLTEPQKVYDAIVKPMTAYYELQKQARLKLYNKRVDQTLKVLD